jgi:hypothetical protein
MSKTAIVHGQLAISKPDGGTLLVRAVEETLAGFRLDVDGPSRTGWPRVRVVGTTDTDADGRFSIEYEPSEAPPDACDWRASVRVDVFDGPALVWTSTARPLEPIVEFRPDVDQAARASSVSHCIVRGLLTACGQAAANLDVVITERVTTGVDQPGEPCIPHSHTREVGRTVTDAAGAFTLTFQPTPDTDHCSFPSQLRVNVFDGEAAVWQSPLRFIGAEVSVNGDLFPECPAGASVVRVFDDFGHRVAGAEVYADGTHIGDTDALGQLAVFPPLVAGQLLAARKLVHEQQTNRPGHTGGGTNNWAYRVYITSVRARYDANGDAVTLPLLAVDDPGQPIDLRVARRNTLIGFNFTVSIEWDASSEERARLLDRLVETSELLYNGTDGQFVIERLHVSESAGGWADADIRIYADLNRRSTGTVNGVVGASGVVSMNPNDANYSGVTLHELGHYALGVGDEYDGPIPCTLQSTDSGTPFSEGGGKDACFMRGSQYKNKKKLCSAHADNPHVAGTDQGAQDCWSGVIGRYGAPWWLQDAWRVLSPTTRGVIVDRLPDSGVPIRRTTQPSGDDVQVPSFIPVAGWKPKVGSTIDHRGVLVDGVVVRTEFNGVPVRKQRVWLHQQSNGRKLLQGVTKDSYNLAYGLTTGDGEIPLRGAHIDDEVTVLGPAPGGGLLVGKATITQAGPHTLVIPLSRILFALGIELEPRGVGALGIKLRPTDAGAAAARPPDVYVATGDAAAGTLGHTRVRPADSGSVVGGLPRDGTAVVVAIVAVTVDGDEIVDEHGVVSFMVDDEWASVWSSDGRLKLRLQARTFDTLHQVLIESPGADSPINTPIGELLSGPYRISIAPDDRWDQDAAVLFRLPSPEVPERNRDEWIASLVVAELEPRSGEWHEHRSTGSSDPAVVSTRIDHSGTYALVRSG